MSSYASNFAAKIEEYLVFRKSIGFSDHHGKALKRFDSYCREFWPESSALTKEVVCGWFNYELTKSDKNLAARGTAIRSFARYVGGNSYILPAEVSRQKSTFSPYIMDDQELFAFFNAIDNYHDVKDPFVCNTFSVMIRLIYTCGLRPREGRMIQTSDIDFCTGEILIRQSKKRKDRLVVASNDMLMLLKHYRVQRSVFGQNKDGYFFINSAGEGISASMLHSQVKRCWAKANPGITPDNLPNLRPYDLRHRFASALLQKWIDEGKDLYAMLPYMRTYMGHVRFEDTAYYIHLLPDRLISSPGVDWESIDQVGLEESIWRN